MRELRLGLRQAAFYFNEVAAAEGLAKGAAVGLDVALESLASPLGLLAIGAAAAAAGIALAGKALAEFSESERAIGRIAIELRNLGNQFPATEAVEFANHLQEITGISHRTTEGLIGLAASFGLTKAQIEKALPAVLDISQAKGLNPQQVLRRLLQATGGRKQGLIALGIDPTKITGDLKDIDNLISQIGKSFGGTAEAFRHTLPGTVDALGTAVTSLFEAIGRFISPVVVPLLNLFIARLEQLAGELGALAALLHIPTAAALGEGKANPLALKGDPEQTEYQRQIANNTAKLAPFVDQVLGGTGEVASRSFTWRDAKAAWGV